MGDDSGQAAEVVALALHHAAHPDVIIQIEAQGAVIPDWPISMPGSLKLLQNLQSAHNTPTLTMKGFVKCTYILL